MNQRMERLYVCAVMIEGSDINHKKVSWILAPLISSTA